MQNSSELIAYTSTLNANISSYIYEFCLCMLKLNSSNATNEAYFGDDTHFVNISAKALIVNTSFTNLAAEVPMISSLMLLCQNVSTSIVNDINSTVDVLTSLITDLTNINIDQYGIIKRSKDSLTSSLVKIPNGLIELSTSLASLLYPLKNSYVDLTSQITTCQNKTKTLLAIVNTNLITNLNTIVLSIPISFNSTYSSFKTTKDSIQQLLGFLNNVNTLLATITTLNNNILSQRMSACSLTLNDLLPQLMMMPDIFRAYSQINVLIANYHTPLFPVLTTYRLNTFLAANFNATISPSVDKSTQFVSSLYNALMSLTPAVGSMYSLNTVANSTVLNEIIKNISIYLNASFVTLTNSEQEINALNSSLLLATETSLNSIKQIIYAALKYTEIGTTNASTLSSRPTVTVPFCSTNEKIDATIVTNCVNKISPLVTNFQTLQTCFNNFGNATVNYIQWNTSYSTVLATKALLRSQILASSSSIDNFLYSLKYLVNTTNNLNSYDRQNWLNALQSLNTIKTYLTQLNSYLLNLTLLANNTDMMLLATGFSSDFLNLTQSIFPCTVKNMCPET